MKKSLILLTLVMLISVFSPFSIMAKTYQIKDGDSKAPAYEAIQDVLNQGWMSLTLSKFYPDKAITRGEFSLILTKYLGQISAASKITKVTFKDIKIKDTYSKYIELQKPYITYYKGKDGLYFKPKNYLTREDALVAIVKASGYDTDEAIEDGAESEVDINEILEDASKISPALRTYVTTGVVNELIDLSEKNGATYLNPKSNITRGQLAQLLINAKNNKEYNKLEVTTDNLNEAATDEDSDSEKGSNTSNTGLKKTPEPTAAPTPKSTPTPSPTPSPTATPTPTPTPTPKASDAKSEWGYLKITINGTEKNFVQSSLGNIGSVYFTTGKSFQKESFELGLPSDVSAGDSLTIKSSSYDVMGIFEDGLKAVYTTNDGEKYIFGYNNKGLFGYKTLSNYEAYKSSEFTYTITSYEGKGSYAIGKVSGSITFDDNSVVHFTNGEFKYLTKKPDSSKF